MSRKVTPLPSSDRLHEVLVYNPDDGSFRWKISRRGVRAGDVPGRICSHGYHEICVDYHLARAHRLAWKMMTGDDPASDIDHINGDRADNRWANLRLATPSQNMANVGVQVNNTSGVPGVVWDKDRNKWRAQLRVGGRKTNLGRFDNKEDAAAAVKAAAVCQWGEYARN